MQYPVKRWVLVLVSATLLMGACKKKEDDPKPIEEETVPEIRKTTYTLNKKDVLGISGTVTFTEKSATETIVDISLSGISTGTHPAHIHAKSAIEGGDIVISLNDVGPNGKSSTIVTKKDNNTPVSYSDLINFDGYVNVHESGIIGNATILAQGDIGGNEITNTSKTYTLNGLGGFGVSGNILFQKRKNNTTLATISLTGTVSGGTHPAHIHIGSLTTPGGIVVTFNPVDGATGKSVTNIRTKDDNSTITYDNILQFTGYVNVHKSAAELDVLLAQGNIGTNVP